MNRFLLLCAASVLAAVGCHAQTVAVIHANAYIVPGRQAVKNATIVIEDGRVSQIGAGILPPAGARVIDASNRIVTPGLMDSDTQLGLVETGSADSTDTAVSSGPLGAAFNVQYALNPNSTLLSVARADGLTRAVTLPTSSAHPPFAGMGAILRLSEGTDILDRSCAAMTAIVGGMTTPRSGGSRNAQWILMREELRQAQLRKAGMKHGSDAPIGDAGFSSINLGALYPVLERKIPLVITAYRESDIRQAISLADEYKIRVVLLGADEAWRAASLLAAHHISVVLNPYADDPATFDQIGARLQNAAILAHAGVTISFLAPSIHASHNAGITIREGAGIAVANGLPWPEALRALTLSAAEIWGIADHYGTLEPGKDADLVIWDGDPLEPMSAPTLVLVRGQQVSLRTRQTDLEQRYSPAHRNDPWPPAYR